MEQVKVNSAYAWVLAARPKTLTGAVMPVMVAIALAYSDGCLHVLTAVLCALFASGMQVAANFINDYYDFKRGSDREDRLGPERACAQGWITPEAMKKGIWTSLVLSCLIGLGALGVEISYLPLHGLEILAIGILCVVFCFLYTTRLSYLGWGDLLVLVFFGIIPVCGTYYLQAHTLTTSVVVASLLCGLVIDTLLVVNNYRDREQDRISHKQTLIVRFGEPFGRYLYLALGFAAALLSVYLIYDGTISGSGFVYSSLIYLYLHTRTWLRMVQIRQGKALNQILGENSRNMFIYGLLLCLAIVLN